MTVFLHLLPFSVFMSAGSLQQRRDRGFNIISCLPGRRDTIYSFSRDPLWEELSRGFCIICWKNTVAERSWDGGTPLIRSLYCRHQSHTYLKTDLVKPNAKLCCSCAENTLYPKSDFGNMLHQPAVCMSWASPGCPYPRVECTRAHCCQDSRVAAA